MTDNINKLRDSVDLIKKLLDGNIFQNFINITPEELRDIDWKIYENELSKKLDEILDKEETKQILMPRIEWLTNTTPPIKNHVEVWEIMDAALRKMNIFWENERTIASYIGRVGEAFRRKWNIPKPDRRNQINYDNLKAAIKETLMPIASFPAEVLPKEYSKLKEGNPIVARIVNGQEVKDIDTYIKLYMEEAHNTETFIVEHIISPQEIHSNVQSFLNTCWNDLEILSSYISVAEGAEKEKRKEIFEKYANIYKIIKKDREEKIRRNIAEKGSTTKTELQNNL